MPDLDSDPNEAYDVIPCDRRPGSWTVTGNGTHRREDAERYATDPEHRKAMKTCGAAKPLK